MISSRQRRDDTVIWWDGFAIGFITAGGLTVLGILSFITWIIS